MRRRCARAAGLRQPILVRHSRARRESRRRTQLSAPRVNDTMAKQPCVYILASRQNGTLYIGVTSDVVKRVWEHKSDLVDGFTKEYGVHLLVWYEIYDEMIDAI